MVAIRGTHLLNPDSFDLKKWSTTLNVPAEVEADLEQAWNFACEKVMARELDKAPIYYLLAGPEMVEILHSLNMDAESLITAMLFPVLTKGGDDPVLDEIEEVFGVKIRKLLKGVADMDNLRQINTANSSNTTQIDNVRRMLLAMVEDFRCVIIKLAERIIFLRDDAHNHTQEERELAAKECSNIYAPLANRLGIGQLKWELEDYCFRVLHPENYRIIAKLLAERRLDREQYLDDFVRELRQYLKDNLYAVEVYGRPKHIYSIWKKMQKKHLEFDQLYDVRAVRIIVKELQDCYAVLGLVHTHFKHLPDQFDDYVANPKPNGYQSIHTVVLGKGNKPVEIQIRTQEMHDNAELGVAAHWKYKEGIVGGKTDYEEKIAWLRKLLAWQADIVDSGDILAEIRSQVFDDRVYVFTPRGEVVDLPTGSTPLDFAYAIHSQIGHRCIGAKVGGRIVPFTYQLQMGDQVDILTQKNPNPSRDWVNPSLGFTRTPKARSRINAFFKKLDREKDIPLGKEQFEHEVNALGLNLKQAEKNALTRYNLKHLDDLYAGIGSGDIRLQHLMNYLQNKKGKATAEQADADILRQVANRTPAINKDERNQLVTVDGVGNLLHYMAGCCQPIYGDEIAGYITLGRGISIHRVDCEQFIEMQNSHPERVVGAHWGQKHSQDFRISIQIVAGDRHGLLRDITTVLANHKVDVLSVSTHTESKKQLAIIQMDIKLSGVDSLSKVLLGLAQIPDIIEAKRL